MPETLKHQPDMTMQPTEPTKQQYCLQRLLCIKGVGANDTLFAVLLKSASPECFAAVLFAFALALSAYFAVKFLSLPILESYGFRQTQTALTTLFLMKNGFSFAYWTPVVGQGWSIPFEFPIYQQITALVTACLGTPLAETGRMVSWVFNLLCCIPAWCFLTLYQVDRKTKLFVLALFLSSPLYLFWGSTFMIESTALFFSLSFVYYAAKIVRRAPGTADYLLAFLFLTLALLQKATTVLPVALIFVGFFSFCVVTLADFQRNKLYLFKTFCTVTLAVIIGYAWVKYSDIIKMQNPIGAKLTSGALMTWNYGSMGQRLSGQLWNLVFWIRVFSPNLGGYAGIAALLGGLGLSQDSTRRNLILVLLAAGFVPFFIFTNLHIVHSYYQTANVFFLIMALGVAVTTVGDRLLGKWPLAYGALLAIFIISNIYHFGIDGLKLKSTPINVTNNLAMKTAAYVKAHTNEDQTVAWYGFDWSSEPVFYAERKSLAVPEWDDFPLDTIRHTDKYLTVPPAAIVLCPTKSKDQIREAIINKYGAIKPEAVGECEIYLTAKKD